MALQAPSPIDVQDFQFKLHCRLKVFENESADPFQQPCSLVSVASRYGLVFVGSVTSSFKVLQISAIEKHILKESSLTDYRCRIINLPSPPKYLEVNCDNTKLAVVVQKDNCPVGLIYDIASFLKINVTQPIEIRLSSTADVNVTQCGWNPAIPTNFTVCKDDGTLSNYDLLGNGIDINELPREAQVMCMCWSPKGKQIAVGSRHGTITQYKPDKPDLKAMRIINAPPVEGSPAIISLQWISTYQFIAVYQPQSGDGAASVITVEAPKTGNTVYTNYEDICYSYGSLRPAQFYMIFQATWNTLMVASSNSMEVGVLGSNNEQWTQWILSDAARAELPLSATKQDTMPVGLAFDTAAVDSIVWGETSLPPAPFLLLLSHHGLLCCFRVINMKASIQSICSPPETFLDTSGLNQFLNMNQVQAMPQKQVINTPATIAPAGVQNALPVSAFTSAPPLSAFQVQSVPKTEPQTLGFNLQPQQAQPDAFQAALPTFSNNLQSEKQPQNVPSQQTVLQIPKPQFSVTPRTEPVSQLPTKPQPPVVVTPAAKVEPKVELPPPYVSPSTDSISQEETNIIISKTIREECEALEIELMNLIQMGRTLKTDIGSDAQATDLVGGTDELINFLNEITITNEEQSNEVFLLKQGLIQTWAWYEDARARFAYAQSETLKTLLNIQNLDPVSLRYSNDIKKITYYIQSQLAQASRVLDEQWENFQDACKNLVRLKIPTMEAIYQTMVRQSAIYQKQKYILKDISNRIRSSRSKVSGPSLLLSLHNADNLEVELLRLQLEPESWLQTQYNRVVDNQKKLTATKVAKLSNFLLKRKITEVTVNKPQLSNTSLQSKLQSHLSKSKSAIESSILGAGFSPITSHKTVEPRAVNFGGHQPTNVQAQMKLFTNSTPVVSGTTVKPFSQSSPSEGQSKNTFTPVRPSSGSAALFLPNKPSLDAVVPEPNKDFTFTVSKVPPNTVSFSSFPPITSTSQFSFNLTTKTPVTTTVATKASAVVADSTTVVSVAPTVPITKPSTSTTSFTSPPSNLFNIKSPAISTASSTFSFAFTPNAVVTTTSTSKPSSNIVDNTSTLFSFGSAASSVSTTAASSTTTFKPSSFSFKQSVESVLTSQSSAPPIGATSIFGGTISTGSENTTKDSLFTEIPSTINTFGTFKIQVPPSVSITPVAHSTTTVVTTTQSQPSLFGGPTATNLSMFSSSVEKAAAAPFKFSFNNPGVNTAPSSKNEPSTTSSHVSTTSSLFANITNTVVPSTSALIITPVYTVASSSITTTASSISSSSQVKTSVSTTSSNLLFGPPTSMFGSTAGLKLGTSGVTITPTSTSVNPIATVSAFNNSSSNVTSPSFVTSSSTPLVLDLSKTTPKTNLAFAPLPTTLTTSTAVPDFSTPTTSFFGQSSNNSSPFSSAQTTTSAAPFSIAQITSPQFGASQTTPNTSFTTPSTTVTLPFAPAPAQQTAVGSPFANPQTTVSSIFGSTQKATAVPFGTSSTFAPTTTASAFSSVGTTGPTGTGSIFASFGNKPAFQSGSSLFNTPTSTTNNTAFGGTTFGGGKPVFGATTSTSSNSTSSFSFAAAANSSNNTAFGGQTQPQSQFAFVDAAKKAEPGSFGFGSLNVQPTSTSSPFTGLGQPANVNPFAKATQEKPAFGGGSLFAKSAPTSSSPSMFGNANTNTGFGAAGGSNSLFGSPSGFGSTASPAFGQQSSFGQPSAFGGGGGTFGSSPQPGSFSAGNQTVGQTGFGAFSQAPKTSGFGSAPIFGGSPGGFGAPATFGGAPAFGSGSAFGGAASAFGDSNAASPGAFNAGPPQQENSTFANLANQNTLGFGSLAQQSQNNPSMSSFSGSPSFSTWR